MNVGRGGRMDWRVALACTAVAALASSATVLAGCRPSVEALDPTTLPENVRSDYHVFERRCSKCHSVARPLTSGITDQGQWESYVTRMRRQPASGITPEDQVVILRFLKYYSEDQLRKKAEKNGTAKPVEPTQAPPSSAPGSPQAPPRPTSSTPAVPTTPAPPSAVPAAPSAAPHASRMPDSSGTSTTTRERT
jgi:hypothetical protein